MKRNQKFKAWDKTKDKWYGNLSSQFLCVGTPDVIVMLEYGISVNGQDPILCKQLTNPEVNNLILVESTGYKDKYKNTIYDGDILESPLSKFQVVWEEGGWKYKNILQGTIIAPLDTIAHRWRKIGNILEPEYRKNDYSDIVDLD